jgi:tetratricopeptide (TPR) repeat protein
VAGPPAEELNDRVLLQEAFRRWYDARRAYQRLRDDLPYATSEQTQQIDVRIGECRDALAERHLQAAAELLRDRRFEEARSEIATASELAVGEHAARRADELSEEAERQMAKAEGAEQAPPSDEDRFVAIAGIWEEEQEEEYEPYGDGLRDALLLLYDDKTDQALPLLEKLLEEAPDPHYLHYEVGRARLLSGDEPGGAEELRRFLSSIGPDEGGAARLSAHVELSRLAKEAGQFEQAVEQLQAAMDAMPGDPRPYLLMGNFLRQEGHPEQAVEVLDAGIAVMGDAHPDWRLIQEMGLARAEAGDEPGAIEMLEQVVDILASLGNLDLPPETATRLAALHEKAGQLARAADLYSMLARGSDADGRFGYYSEAGRLLAAVGMEEEARRMLVRAAELAPEDEQVREQLRARLDALGGRVEPPEPPAEQG